MNNNPIRSNFDLFFICPLYLLMNIGMGILVPSVFTLISYQKTSKGDSFIPVYRSIQGMGVIIGPIVGGFFIGHSYQGNVLFSGVFMLVSTTLFAMCFAKEEKLSSNGLRNETRQSKFNFTDALKEIIHNRAFLVLMLLFAMIELSYDLLRLNLPIVGTELNFDTEVIGTALSAYFITFTLFQIPINNALKRLERRTALVFMGILSLIPCTNIISPIITAGLAGIHIKGPYILAVFLVLIFVTLSMFFYKKIASYNV